MSLRNGVLPAGAKPLPTEHTKLLGDDDVELEKEVKAYFHTKYAGLLALIVVICTTICQAEAVQWLQTSVNFKKPFFTMCACHVGPILLLPLILAYYRICGGPEDRHVGFVRVLQNHSIIPISRLIRLAAFLGVFYLVADYFWFSAFKHLTVATGAAIFNSSPLFVYCFSICFLHEKISLKKLLGVLTAFGGVTLLVFFQDDANAESVAGASIVGGLMMLTAAAVNAGYNVSVALTAAEEMNDTSTLMIMMGISGFFTIPAWLIGTVVFANSPFPSIYESVGFPSTAEGMLMVAIAVGMFTVNFVFLTFAVCWSSPLEVSVGYMFTIPLSGLMDTVLHHASFSWECIIGSVLVMAGFAILELSSTHPPSHHSVDQEDGHTKA
ncbi:hypothetical protein PHYBOEH_001706 [Phytophthora boehmeriae]|uniref:EamA domain-containing protein n=1 Tax=Phytophthora boehmeriae TaxID=109152 RepID=A0A8T1WX42_9STRA|nr:hypothetical protein PHYBOEH_001706 [Phytophthora boehmeriae]